MSRADYDIIAIDDSNKIVQLVDLDLGNMSVTNDAETVVKEVNKLCPGYRILYRDSIEIWDELVHDNGVFIKFAPWRESL